MKRFLVRFPSLGHIQSRFFLGSLVSLGFFSGGKMRAQELEGSFTIIPVSAPEMVMEAVDAGTNEGAAVSLGHPSAKPNKVWIITPKGDGFYTLRPSYSANLVLAASRGKADNGTAVILERESDKPWQLWSLRGNTNGSFSLMPKHAPDKGLDDFLGGRGVGTKQDLWDYSPENEHLQWVLKPLDGSTISAAANQPVILQVPKGITMDFTFAESVIFPGTRRRGTVFIPAQYDGSNPACVYVQQDGYNPVEKGKLETLIASKDIPVTIGIFITPGELLAPRENTLGRRNRCFEYDGVGDNYVCFLTDEILPYVAKTFDLNLSTNGNDRCIAGNSSGGIAAFNCAWQRPDAFSRVYATSGSFVAFRGGNELSTLVRKSEARPIRAYLTSGTQDMENCAGDWYLLDQEMDKALTFSGYDHFFRFINGTHGIGQNEFFPEAMRFLWKGWPEPVKAGPSAPRVRDIINANEKWELVCQGYNEACSPACSSTGTVFFIDTYSNSIYRIDLGGRVEVFIADAAKANALSIGPNDEIYTVSRSTGNILCYDQSGQSRVVADGILGNYILARPDGSIYVTSSNKNISGTSDIWLVKDGRKTIVDSGLRFATGMAYRPDHWLLSVADGHSKWVYSYQIQPDGTLINKERFFWLHVADWDDDTGAESVCYAMEGPMFVATRMGIQVCADDGPTQVILPLPDHSRVMGVCLGGAGMNTLFAFGAEKVWKRVVKTHASGAFSPLNKISRSQL